MSIPRSGSDPGWPAHDRDTQQPQGTPEEPPPDIDQNVQMRATVDRVNHIVMDAFGIPTGNGEAIKTSDSGGAGNYFKVSPDQIRDYEKRLHSLVERAQQLHAKLDRQRRSMYPPAEDPASIAQAQAAADTIAAAQKHLQGIIAYGNNYHNKLARSVGDYENIEQVNASEVKKAANDDGSVI